MEGSLREVTANQLIITGLPQKLQNQIPGLSRTFSGHFPGLFQDCLRFFLYDLKFNLTITISCTYSFVLVIDEKF